MLISIDGERVDPAAATVSVFDRGFLFGDAIYEVCATHQGKLTMLGAHLDRLEASGAAIGIDVASMRAGLEAEIARLIEECPGEGERYVRIMITRGASTDFDLAEAETEPKQIVLVKQLKPWEPRLYEAGIDLLCVSPDQLVARIAPSVKSNNRQANVMAHRFARAQGKDDALFVDTQGNVTEGPSWNMFGVKEGKLWTSPLAGGVLPGITRSTVLKIAAELGIEAEERAVSQEEALASDEWFITSTTRGVMPVASLDGRAAPAGSPGPLTQRISAAWRALADG